MFGNVYENCRVLITGHSGFKGSWLAEWLVSLGARVCGVSLRPVYEPNHFGLLKLPVLSEWANIRELGELRGIIDEVQPEIIFHLAAQPLVRQSYLDPVETFVTNVMGTIHVLEAARSARSLRAVVAVTSDKCYENRETGVPFQEEDPMGGFDPYSCSKGCAELAISAYRRSFFPAEGYGSKHHVLIASARAGNVIGGGDWAPDRLVPDLVRSASRGGVETLRSPGAVRPWQHVLEPLSGYLELGRRLLNGDVGCASAWNFGPDEKDGTLSVLQAAELLSRYWDEVKYKAADVPAADAPHEARLLRLDCTKARKELQWRPVWDASTAFRKTAEWYRDYYRHGEVKTVADREAYVADAVARGMVWCD